jgi:hypothetical protein
VVAKNCDGLVIDNLKICCANMICDDGIDLVNTRHVVIRNTFVRTMDDCICAKGMDPGVDAEWRALGQPCEDIEVSNCVLWSDAANVFRIGFESMAQAMRRIRVCDIDVIHLSAVVRDVSHFYANCAVNLQPTRGMPMSDLIFEDIRFDDVPEHSVLIKAHLDRCSFDGQRDTTTGSLSGCVFRNFSFPPGVDGGVISLLGAGPANTIENVAFENIGPHRDMRIGDSPKNIRIETVPTVSHP